MRLVLETHKKFKSAKKLGKPKNFSKNMTSEQDQVFGANPKIGREKKVCFCHVLTTTKKKAHLQLIYKF